MSLTCTNEEYPGYQRRVFECPVCGETMTQWAGVSRRVVERRYWRATKKCEPINFIAVLGGKAKPTQPPDFEIRHRSRVAE
jgi:predicted RNA-binding Zn-ribbon protein involved in translation (DUF1610 family)